MTTISIAQCDAINGDLYEVETVQTDEGKKYFVRSLISNGDESTIGFESGLHLKENDAWADLHTELCRRSRKPLTTRWYLRAHRCVLSVK